MYQITKNQDFFKELSFVLQAYDKQFVHIENDKIYCTDRYLLNVFYTDEMTLSDVGLYEVITNTKSKIILNKTDGNYNIPYQEPIETTKDYPLLHELDTGNISKSFYLICQHQILLDIDKFKKATTGQLMNFYASDIDLKPVKFQSPDNKLLSILMPIIKI